MDEQKKTSGSLALNSTPQVITISPSDPVRARKLRVAAYARVSSSSEDQLNSFAAQNAHYTELITANPEWEFVDVYADKGITGTSVEKREDFQRLLRAGADKISVNSAAVARPELIAEAAERFGSQCVVLAVDARSRGDGTWEVVVAGGRKPTGMDLIEWVKRGEALGAGEILLTSMDADGTKAGFDLAMTKAVTDAVSIPVIASGGCGSLAHFAEVFEETGCDAALAASLFHFGELTVPQVKEYLETRQIPVR